MEQDLFSLAVCHFVDGVSQTCREAFDGFGLDENVSSPRFFVSRLFERLGDSFRCLLHLIAMFVGRVSR